MKHKVSELEGMLLDRAVGLAEGYEIDPKWGCNMTIRESGGAPSDWNPSTEWAQGGPLIERERIELRFCKGWEEKDTSWESAANPTGYPEYELEFIEGPTALIAAMRAYVASKFGAEVELP